MLEVAAKSNATAQEKVSSMNEIVFLTEGELRQRGKERLKKTCTSLLYLYYSIISYVLLFKCSVKIDTMGFRLLLAVLLAY